MIILTQQIPMYVHLITLGNYAIMSPLNNIPGAVVQNDGDPVITLCASPGSGRLPLYQFVSSVEFNPGDNLWGNTFVAPDGIKCIFLCSTIIQDTL
jgi:hypothetical protein